MSDLRSTIVPKSDQLNSDDLIGRTITIKITKVLLTDAPEQPVAIHFEGADGKPYMACKSMRRVLVNVWGPDGNAFVGRSLTLYRDPNVTFGGLAVGGIRISHMSNIDKPVTMALTATRANRKPFTVKPLVESPAEPPETVKKKTWPELLADVESMLGHDAAPTRNDVELVIASEKVQWALNHAKNGHLEKLDMLLAAARARVTPPIENAPEHAADIDDGWPGPETRKSANVD